MKILNNTISFKNKINTVYPKQEDLNKYDSPMATTVHIRKKAKKINFDWNNEKDLFKHLGNEINEFKEGVKNNDRANMKEELGDILFISANIGRWFNIDPDEALKEANQKFIDRFEIMNKIKEKPFSEYKNIDDYSSIWKKAKVVQRTIDYYS